MRLIEDDLLDRCGLTHVEFEVLLRLALAPALSAQVRDLAKQSILTRSGVSRAVARLTRAALVRRPPKPTDGRGTAVELTTLGLRTFRSAARGHAALVRREFLSLFGETELVQLATMLTRRRADSLLKGMRAERTKGRRPRQNASSAKPASKGRTSRRVGSPDG